MKRWNTWFDLSLINLCIVAALGFILRSKIVFSMPGVNYINVLYTHGHFAFGGWVTFALFQLMLKYFLPGSFEKPVYNRISGGIMLSMLGILCVTPINKNIFLISIFSGFFILITYVFSWMFLKDIRKTGLNRSARLLAISAIISLIISSSGPIIQSWLQSVGSTNVTLFRDTTYVYLHFQYNAFFTLAVFALLFHKIYPKITEKTRRNFHIFSVLLCLSIIPSLFLSFLWQDPGNLYRIMAAAGSLLILASISYFVVIGIPLMKYSKMVVPAVRYLIYLAVFAFTLKMYLQSLTIFPKIGNAVFGDRPVIIGFLHLVFLGFVTPFILAYYVQGKILDAKIRLTGFALSIFMIGVAGNEICLMLQGGGAMLLISSYLFSWLLWVMSILLAIGALLILAARFKSKARSQRLEHL